MEANVHTVDEGDKCVIGGGFLSAFNLHGERGWGRRAEEPCYLDARLAMSGEVYVAQKARGVHRRGCVGADFTHEPVTCERGSRRPNLSAGEVLEELPLAAM